jgi:hypothetical protein
MAARSHRLVFCGNVEVLQIGSVRTSDPRRTSPLPRHRRAHQPYTLNCEEPVITYTGLGWGCLGLLDQGEVLDIGEVHEHAEDGTLFEWLRSTFSNYDPTVVGPAERQEALAVFGDISESVGPQVRR